MEVLSQVDALVQKDGNFTNLIEAFICIDARCAPAAAEFASARFHHFR
jgi:hypothetical protein